MLPTCARRESSVDCGALYETVRQRLVGLVAELPPECLERTVPATPDWRVRDVLAHVVGITHDLNRSVFGAETPEQWTARQVAQRRTWPVAEIVAEWDAEAPTFEEGLRLFGYGQGSHFVADLITHLRDIEATLHLPSNPDPLPGLVALDFYLGSLDEALRAAGAGTIVVSVAKPTGGYDAHEVGEGEPRATLTGGAHEVLRALAGRRTLAQIRAMTWSGAADALAPLVSRYPLPEHDLAD